MFGHNTTPANFDAFRIQASVTDATPASEDATIVMQNMQGGTLTTLITLAVAVVTIAGTLNATTLQQDGTDLDDIVEDAIDSLDLSRTVSGAFTLAATDAGRAIRFTGASNVNVTVGRLSQDDIITIHNDGTGDLTCVSAAASDDVTFQNGVTIAAGATATLIKLESGGSQATNVWRILGQNT